MNSDWAEKCRQIQVLLKNQATCRDGIQQLLSLRQELFAQITNLVNGLPGEAFYQMPYANAKGYHSKTLAYSIWHIFRIEDIVSHTLIRQDTQILFASDYQTRIGTKRITTGNELQGEQIAVFSKELDIRGLYAYARAVMESTDALLRNMDYPELRRKFGESDRERLARCECVSKDESANWLIQYWCGKNVLGLVNMPFCRHWIIHIEAMLRIKNRLCKLARKGVDPIAYCGFSCNHCFLAQWCGSCRTDYSICSYATCFADHTCPNAACCQSKMLDGCYECDELYTCVKGFYAPENDGANAAKAQAMFIRKYGKKAFLNVHKALHAEFDFAKTQEILGQDVCEGLAILEETYTRSLA